MQLYNLTYPQKNIWLMEKYNGNTPLNYILGVVEIKNGFDYKKCNDAINDVIKNNDAMRIVTEEKDSNVCQYVKDYEYVNFENVDMSLFSDKEKEKYINDFGLRSLFSEKNVYYDFKILKYSDNEGIILAKLHHIISDAWSFGNIGTQIIDHLEDNDVTDNKKPSYIDYIKSEDEYKNSEKYKKDELFWQDYLKDIKESISLKDNINRVSSKAKRYSVLLDENFSKEINNYCKENKISPYILFLTALSVYLYRIKDKNEFVIGTPTLNRSNFKEKNMLGMFVSTLPFRAKITEDIKFIDLAKQFVRENMSLFRHQKYPYEKMLEYVHKNTSLKTNLYNILLSYQNARITNMSDDKYNCEWKFLGNIEDEIQIHIMDINNTGNFNINYDYLVDLFTTQEIKYLHSRLIAIIKNAISNVDISIEDIDIMSDEEKDIILGINNTEIKYNNLSILNLFKNKVIENKNKIALINKNNTYTYEVIDQLSNKLANLLVNKYNIRSGDKVGIFLKRDINLIISLLAILKCDAKYIPIDITYPKDRIKYIISQSCLNNLIVYDDLKINENEDKNINYININTCNFQDFSDEFFIKNENNGGYIIYTSGTTGNPKGVEISIPNLYNFIMGISDKLKLSDNDILVSITSVSFDIFGLETWVTLCNGLTLVLATEEEQNDQKLLNSLCMENNVNIIQTTPTKLQLLINDTKYIEYLKNMKKIILGGETLNSYIFGYLKSITKANIINVYGPTETTIWSTYIDLTNKNSISVGKPISNTQTYILDKKKRLLPLNISGELFIGGMSVSSGYYNDNELTSQKFIKFINNKVVYDTGDIALLDFEQNINIIGRSDFQVKINGQRVELQEIENSIITYGKIKKCVVIYKDKKLICFYEKNTDEINIEDLKNYLSKKIFSYMIPKKYIMLEKLPTTANGKTDRKKLNNFELKVVNIKEKIRPNTKIQEELVQIFKELLNISDIGLNENLYEYNFDSLNAIKLVSIVKDYYNMQLNVNDVMMCNNILEIEKLIKRSHIIESLDDNKLTNKKNKFVSLNSQQKGIFASYSENPNITLYNMPFQLKIKKYVDVNKLKLAIESSIKNHEVLFTRLKFINGDIGQIIKYEDFELEIKYFNNDKEYDEYKRNFVKPFDLLGERLFRCSLCITNNSIYFLFDVHHIIFDGTSFYILLDDINKAYHDEKLIFDRFEKINYEENTKYEKSKKYFIDKFNDELPTTIVPTDKIRSRTRTYNGSKILAKLDENLYNDLLKYSKEKKVTLNNIFLSMFNFVISKYVYNQDIVIGLATLGRKNIEEFNKIGMFVKTLPYRTNINYSQSILEYITNTQKETNELLDNSDYSYYELVNELRIKKDLSMNPLFNIMFVFQNMGIPNINLDDQKVYIRPLRTNISKFDLSCEVIPGEKTADIIIEYSKDIYYKDTIVRFLEHYINSLKNIFNVQNLCDVEIISKEEKDKVLYNFNNTSTNYPKDKTISMIFEDIVKKHSNKTALIHKDRKINFEELNKEANKIAHYLRSICIKRNDVIAVVVDKSFEMVEAILGIIKSGACYLPIDPSLPEERITYMIKNSNTKYIINNTKDKKLNIDVEYIDLNDNRIKKQSDCNLENINNIDDMAYIMYTSGSTGKPKGCMNTHRGVIKLVKNINYLDLNKVEYIFMAGNLVFDSSLHETWLSMLNGITGILIEKNIVLTPDLYKQYFDKYKNVLAIFTTQLFHQYADNMPDMFKNAIYILSGGDVLLSKYVDKVRKVCKNTNIINIYGPAECSAASTTQLVNDEFKNIDIPIGYPISNTKCYILDKCGKICPIGVMGELYIGGDGVGLGYLNRDDLTKKSFTNISLESNSYKIEKVYKSGDIVKWLPKGNIAFIGRQDKQIKIRGYRVEISEIENIILKYNNIKEVKIVLNKTEKDKNLVVYFVAKNKINIPHLKKKISNKLPSYMVPKYYVQIPIMPLKPNGKIDVQKLPDIKILQSRNKKLKLPRNFIEEKLVNIACGILDIDEISVDDNLFDCGLDSILATRLCIECINNGINIIYSDIFDYPTIEELANLISVKRRETVYTDIEKYDYSKINKLLKDNVTIQNDKIKDILLTGVNGFLGSHILAEYLDNFNGIAYCIVREKNKISGKKRLKSIMHYYFGKKYDKLFNTRIKVIEKEILDNDIEEELKEYIINSKINCVIHSAARVKHYGRKAEFYKLNVDATDKIINLCIKYNLRLIHISTLSVSGNGMEGKNSVQTLEKNIEFTEDDLYIGQKLSNIYSYTKYLAELSVLENIIEKNLKATIIRVGNLMGRSYDGKFQKNKSENAFVDRIRFIIENKIIPKNIVENDYFEISPVDLTAKGILKISNLEKSNVIYHLFNYNYYSVSDFIEYLKNKNINIKIVRPEEFYKKLKDMLKKSNFSNNAILSDLNTDNQIEYSTKIKINYEKTKKILKSLDFSWNMIDNKYWDNFFNELNIRNIITKEK